MRFTEAPPSERESKPRWVQLAVCLGWAADLIGLPEPPPLIGQAYRS